MSFGKFSLGGAKSDAKAKPSFGFGSKAPSAAAKPSSFGGKPSSFGGAKASFGGKPSTFSSSSSSKPAAAKPTFGKSSSFGGAAAQPSTSTAAPSKFGGFNKPAAATSAPAARPTFSGSKPASSSMPSSFGASKPGAAAKPSFGSKPAAASGAAKPTFGAKPSFGAKPAAAGGAAKPSFGGAAKPSFGGAAKVSSFSAPSSTPSSSGDAKKGGSFQAPSGGANPVSVLGGAANPLAQGNKDQNGSALHQMDSTARIKPMVVRDIINTWTHDLESHVESFMEQARQIKKWDTQMMENRNKIYGLGHHVEDLKAQQGLLTETLEKILTSQSELRATFERLEEEAPDVKSTNDIEIRREETYKLAEHIDTRLNMMEDELGGIIENLNTSAETYDDPNSPVSNILSILNEHTTVLQWLDDAALDVESKLRDADMRLKDVDIARSSAMM